MSLTSSLNSAERPPICQGKTRTSTAPRLGFIATWLLMARVLFVGLAVALAQDTTEPWQQLSKVVRVRAVFAVDVDAQGGFTSRYYTLCGPGYISDDSDLDAIVEVEETRERATMAATAGKLHPVPVLANETPVATDVPTSPETGWCGLQGDGTTPRKAFLIEQAITWTSVHPPGIFPTLSVAGATAAGTGSVTTSDLFYRCAVYGCDMQNQLPDLDYSGEGSEEEEAGVVHSLPAAYGGLSPASPCCASTNNTFILLPPAPSLSVDGTPPQRRLVQTDKLPLSLLLEQSQSLLNEVICDGSSALAPYCSSPRDASDEDSDSDSDSSSASLVAPASMCLLRLQSPRFSSEEATLSGPAGDGGLTFPVAVSLCGADVSDAISSESARLLQRGYHAMVTMHHHVDSVAFPHELIRALASWMAVQPGQTAQSLLGATFSKNRLPRCVWRTDPAAATFYRSGSSLVCELDAAMVGQLPPVTLTVSPAAVIASTSTDKPGGVSSRRVPCAFSLDLNKLIESTNVTASNGTLLRVRHTLVLHGSGSLTDAFRTDSLVSFREPYVVIGAAFLDGATLAVARGVFSEPRNPSLPPVFVTNDEAVRGLPLLFLAACQAKEKATTSSTDPTAVCVAPRTCSLDSTYYRSFNLCGDTNCMGIFAYTFDPVTMRCSLRPVMLALFGMFAFLLIVGDVVLILVGRWAERRRRAHVKLVEQVQRKNS